MPDGIVGYAMPSINTRVVMFRMVIVAATVRMIGIAKKVATFTVATLAFVCSTSSAFAQSDVSVGYQFVRLMAPDGTTDLPVGLGVEYAHDITRGWRAVATFDLARRNQSGNVDAFYLETRFMQSTLAGGLRLEVNLGVNAQAYFQAAVGVALSTFRATSNGLSAIDSRSNDLMFQPGVGLVSRLAGRVGIFGEFAYRRVWPHESSELFFEDTLSGFRVMVGVHINVP